MAADEATVYAAARLPAPYITHSGKYERLMLPERLRQLFYEAMCVPVATPWQALGSVLYRRGLQIHVH